MLRGQGVDDSVEGLLERIGRNGPTRVVVDRHAQAKPPERALAMGIPVDVVFVRGDGWTLGAPEALEWVAYNTWAGDWTAVLVKGEDVPFIHMTPSEYLERMEDA
jgi:hypothetical protein